jgi:hypothetical protein
MPSPRLPRLLAAAGMLLACAALAASAAAEPGADYPQPSTTKIGDTPADFAQPTQPTAPAAEPGDTPEDFPGASRSPAYEQPTIQVVRPERTIVREVDPLLPSVLAGLALILALAAAALAAIAVRSLRRSGTAVHARSAASPPRVRRAVRRRSRRDRAARS